MALLFADGFPYDTTKMRSNSGTRWVYYAIGAGSGTIEVGGRFGGRFMYLTENTNPTHLCRCERALGSNIATVCVQFGVWLQNNADHRFMYLNEASVGEQVHLAQEGGFIRAYRGATLLGSSSSQISMSTWHQIEVKVTIHGSAGIFLVKVDGVTVINLTSQNTQATAHAYANSLGLYADSTIDAGYSSAGFSDVIVMDTTGSYCNDLLGVVKVQNCMPTADGNYHAWTPSTGTDHYALVDEIPPAETDYNSSAAAGDIDMFVVPDVPAAAAVYAVVGSIYSKCDDAGGASLKAVARSNNVDGYGNIVAVPQSSNWLDSVIYVDPNTNQPFTGANFNAAEFGYKREA